MSVSGVSSSSSLSQSMQTWQAKAQKIQSEFQQLGQDLQAGNFTQAQSDFSTLSQNISTPMQTNGSLSQAFAALGTALQSGNLAAAQKAYSTLQQDVQQTGQGHHHHHHAGGSSQTRHLLVKQYIVATVQKLGISPSIWEFVNRSDGLFDARTRPSATNPGREYRGTIGHAGSKLFGLIDSRRWKPFLQISVRGRRLHRVCGPPTWPRHAPLTSIPL